MVLLYYAVHKIYDSLFGSDEEKIDPRFFFTKKFGIELLIIGLFPLLIGAALFFVWLGTLQEIFQYLGIILLILGALMVYRGILKIIVFRKDKN